MKLTEKSKNLMSFFLKNKLISESKHTQKTDSILLTLYDDILNAYAYLLALKKNKREKYYKLNIKKILSVNQITKPKNFNSNSFPKGVRQTIDDNSSTEILYTFSLFDRNIKVFFIVEESIDRIKIETYNKHIDNIVMWIYILNEYGSKKCSANFTTYFYFTKLEKKVPDSNIDIIDQIHVNTGFTTTCPVDSEIVIFREEEWFKVFMHETIHNFALDFSDMNNTSCHRTILNIFKVSSQVNLYEAYTEFWAEIMNILFCSFLSLKKKEDEEEFLTNCEFLINFERTYSFFQMVKALDFMGLKYVDLYHKTPESEIMRSTLYKENTNVLAYYVIKTIMLNNHQSFLSWCKINNLSLLQFKKTASNQREFCKFIEKNYKTKSMLENVDKIENFYDPIKDNSLTSNKASGKNDVQGFILHNMRMSLCEMG
jgi:hypothetical protein